MNMNEQKLLERMKIRKAALQNEIDRDKGGGLADSLAKWQEVKYWIEAIERKEFHDKEDGEVT
jgi:hypothetical protein